MISTATAETSASVKAGAGPRVYQRAKAAMETAMTAGTK
jgi:hypothetical protein